MKEKPPILVVDYDPEWRKFVSHVLRQDGYTVHLADDVQSAFREIKVSNFELIIIDAPLLSALCTLIAEPFRYRLLVVTTSPSVPEAIAAYRWGASDYINKAFGELSLLSTVAAVLGRKPAQQRLTV